MKIPGLRHSAEQIGGIVFFGRMLDKIRLRRSERLPAEYLPNFGLSAGLDGHLCGFLGVEFSVVCEGVRQGGTDDEIAEWCFQHGLRPSKMQVRIWNEFARKFGYDDVAAKFLARIKAEDGLEHRTDIVTTFDLIDLREGRGEGSEASASLESPSPLR